MSSSMLRLVGFVPALVKYRTSWRQVHRWSAELFQQHLGEHLVGVVHADGVHHAAVDHGTQRVAVLVCCSAASDVD